jgi:hypothetical protein
MTNYRVQMSRVPASILEDWKATGVGAGLIAAVTEAAKNAKVSVPGMTKDKNGNYGLDDGTLFVDEWEKALKGMTTSTFDINGNVTVNINGKKLDTGPVGSGTYKDPKQGGQVSSALGDNMLGSPKRTTLKGDWEKAIFNSTREMVKDYAKEMGYTKDQYFTLVNEDGSSTMFKVNDNKGNIIKVKEIPKPVTKHDGGSVSGPGTGTSDSIPAYLSNGEYVIKEKAVRKYGVQHFNDLNAERFHKGGGKFNIPRFETGINSVPADMLAMLHKNEAVVPANMNPFNPNANNATMGGGVYNITNNISGYDGNLEQLSSMVTQKTITAIKSMDSRGKSMVGPQMNVGIN